MGPFFVVVGLLTLGGAIVAWATRPTATYTHIEKRERRTTGPVLPAEPRAFARAPVAAPPTLMGAARSPATDPFAHAPALSDLGGASPEMRE